MFAGITAGSLIGALGAALQVLAVATLLLSKLDEMLLALRRVLGNVEASTAATHTAAKIAAVEVNVERAWDRVGSAEQALLDAEDRTRELRAVYVQLRSEATATESAGTEQKVALITALGNRKGKA